MAQQTINQGVDYRLNRRAAFVLTIAFGILASVVGAVALVRQDPKAQQQRLRQAIENNLARDHKKEAVLQLCNLVRLAPDDVAAWRKIGSLQLELSERENASTALGKRNRAERLRHAVAAFRHASELDPNHAATEAWLLELALRAGHWDEAKARRTRLRQIDAKHKLLQLADRMIPGMKKVQ